MLALGAFARARVCLPFFLGSVCLINGSIALGKEPPSISQFREQLDAGEFAPALALTQSIEEKPQRDAWLVELAEAQVRSGARGAALSTLAGVSDDRLRGEAAHAAGQVAPREGNLGGSRADFDTLIELITTTVRPTTWDEVGGPGTISPFRNGVHVDPHGELKRVRDPRHDHALAVARLAAITQAEHADHPASSPFRKVSLTRLEKHVQVLLAAGLQPDDEMLHLAGLEKIKYVMVYPETGDLVLAGPASAWHLDDEGRAVSIHSGRPVLQLDDFVVLLRYLTAHPQGTFGCSIEPTQQGLARTRAFAEQSHDTPIKPAQRTAWLRKLRDKMGRQGIEIAGIEPRSRVARVLVEADYRMKLVGMGLEKGTVDVPSYLSLIEIPRGAQPPPLDLLRWWFTLNYDAVQTTAERDAFELRGQGVQVLSENELLTHLGQRVHTGKSEPLNQEFANRFTQHFTALAQKYPVYADLQNLFDLSMVCGLLQSEHLADRVGWYMSCFGNNGAYHVALGPAPQSVETVINHRVIGGKHIIVGVSGGVRAQPAGFVSAGHVMTDTYGRLRAQRANSAADKELPLSAWWWD